MFAEAVDLINNLFLVLIILVILVLVVVLVIIVLVIIVIIIVIVILIVILVHFKVTPLSNILSVFLLKLFRSQIWYCLFNLKTE